MVKKAKKAVPKKIKKIKKKAIPPSKCFPTPDPNVFTMCDYNPISKNYDLNCRAVSRAECEGLD